MTQTIGDSTPVVLVDDESTVLLSSKVVLNSVGINHVETLEDSREVMPFLSRRGASAVVLDLFMPYVSGTQLLSEIVAEFPEMPVIVMTASQEVETAVACMKEGAFDYLVKPVEESRLVTAVKRALEIRSLRNQVETMKRSLISGDLEHGDVFTSIVTQNRKMRALFQYVEAVAGSFEPVLITGETGAGKELLAQAVHDLSGRPGEFVQVNVAGLDDTLFSDTLFGHRKGAYTGATQAREGLVAGAARGTLFLDEIGDLHATSQVKLLRLVQEQTYFSLGSDVAKRSDVRIVCATNRDLRKSKAKRSFRSDLFFRLSVHTVDIPPLRDRKDDLPLLIAHFLDEAARSMHKKVPKPPPELFHLLSVYDFPGNVRELRSLVYDAVARHKKGSVLSMKSFRAVVQAQRKESRPTSKKSAANSQPEGRFPTLKEAQAMHVNEALQRAGGNQGVAASLLGISRPALNRRLSRMQDDAGD